MDTDDKKKESRAVTMRAFLVGLVLSGLFAWFTALMDNADVINYRSRNLSANLIPVLPHVLLLAVGLLVNPLLKRIRLIRCFTRAELLLVFVMTAVSAGAASWGLSGALVPVISGLSNAASNNDQSQWDVTATPFLKEDFFIAGKGTQAAAQHLREVFLEHKQARDRYQAARDLQLAKSELVRIKADLELVAATPDPAERTARERLMVWPHNQAIKMVERTEADWQTLGGGEDPLVVVETYSAKIALLKTELDRRREALKALNSDAFAAVEKIRKGFPAEKRALPGFFYTRGEGWASYKARTQRLRIGRRSRQQLAALEGELAAGGGIPAGAAVTLRASVAMLEEISDIPVISRKYAQDSERLAGLEDQVALQEAEGRRLRQERRYATQAQFASYNDRIDEADERVAALKKDTETLRHQLEHQIRPLLDVCSRVKLTQTALLALADRVEKGADTAVVWGGLLEAIEAYPSFDASLRRFWVGDADWALWLPPLFNWLAVIFLGYMVFMTFNTLIFRQWAHHEKLIYPLSEVASLLAGEEAKDGKTLLRSGLFWTGFCIAAGILGWNFLATESIIPNISPVLLETLWNKYVGSGVLKGLGSTYFCVIFAVIGVAFLVPSKISFSLWFFEVLYMGLLLVMVWLGYGNDRWSLHNVGRAGIGSGAMLVFGLSILWTCRQYLVCVLKPSVLKGVPADEARELRVSSGIFLGASLALMLVLIFVFGANPWIVVLFYLVMITMTIALVRAVAEGGVLGIQSYAGMFGAIQTLLATIGLPLAPAGLAPLAIFSSLLFGGFRAFIAPLMANALKVREEFQMRRLHFHGAVWAAIVVASLTGAVTLILLSYQYGADNLHAWLNKAVPEGAFNSIKGLVTSTGEVKMPERLWLVTGAVLMGGLLFGRQRFFGMPHPIGLLMIMNPNMFGYWGSILIGWGCKSVVSKYCTHDQYVSIRRFFIGLIVGHLVAVLFGWDPLKFHWG